MSPTSYRAAPPRGDLRNSTGENAPCQPRNDTARAGNIGPSSIPGAPAHSPLDANHLTQRVDHVDQVALGLHDGVDGLVGARGLVEDGRVLAALDAGGRAGVIGHTKSPLGLGPRHGTPRPVATALEALRIAAATHDVGPGSHAAGDDAEFAGPGPHRSLAG